MPKKICCSIDTLAQVRWMKRSRSELFWRSNCGKFYKTFLWWNLQVDVLQTFLPFLYLCHTLWVGSQPFLQRCQCFKTDSEAKQVVVSVPDKSFSGRQDTQHNTTQHKGLISDTQHKRHRITTLCHYAESRYAECAFYLLLSWMKLFWVSWRLFMQVSLFVNKLVAHLSGAH